jgi:hypothetical protein
MLSIAILSAIPNGFGVIISYLYQFARPNCTMANVIPSFASAHKGTAISADSKIGYMAFVVKRGMQICGNLHYAIILQVYLNLGN